MNPLYNNGATATASRRIADLRARMETIDGEQRSILDAAEGEARNLSRRESARYRELGDEHDELADELRTLEEREERRAAAAREFGNAGGARTAEVGVLGADDSFRDWVRARRGGIPSGLGDDEIRAEDVSLVRMLRAKLDPSTRGDLNEHELRALGEGTDAAGGVLVPELLAGDVIDRLRARSVCIQAGAQTVPMGSDTTVIARLNGASEANWKSENAAVAESDQTWERVELKAKTAVVLQRLSVELFQDMSAQGEQTMRNELAQALALKLDLAALEGAGVDPEPLGLVGAAGVNALAMGANGAMPDSFDPIVQAVYACLKANAPDPSAVVMHPRDGETFALLKDSTGQPLRRPDAIANLPFLYSSQIATDRTVGTSGDTSNAYVGAFSEMLIGVRPSISVRFVTLQERYMDNLQVGLLAYLRADVALAHGASFTKITGIRNA
jgi:HK97 family phage major capsid protein